MEPTRTIRLTESEAWLIDDLVRHTWSEGMRAVGKDLLIKVFSIITEFEARRTLPYPPRELPIALTEDECWAIDFHIRRGSGEEGKLYIGQQLLLKVFDALLALRNDDEARRAQAERGQAEPAEPSLREDWRDRLREYLRRDLDAPEGTPSPD